MSVMLLENSLKSLRLPTMLREYESIGRECVGRNAAYEDYLEQLTSREVSVRNANAIERRLNAARFPNCKELVDFEFSCVPSVNKRRVLDLARCEYIISKSNIVIQGPPGTGKTHVAIGLAREACRQGYQAKFYTAASLVREYLEAQDERRVTRLENSLSRLDLVVIDELGYLPLDRVGAEHLFSFFSHCYEQCSSIITTNLPFADWPQTLGNDTRLAGALIDRLTHRIHVIEMNGESYRLRQSLRQGTVSKPKSERPSPPKPVSAAEPEESSTNA